MKNIKLLKIEYADIEVLQHEIEHYFKYQEMGLCFWTTEEFLNALTAIDIANRLWFELRKKMESDSQYFNLNFKVSDAIIVMRCCLWERSGRTEYQKFITNKIKDLIDKQLKAFIPTQQ